MENNKNYYEDVRKVLNKRNIVTKIKSYEEFLEKNSIEREQIKVERKKIEAEEKEAKKSKIKEIIYIATTVLILLAMLLGPQAYFQIKRNNEIENIKTVMRELNPGATEQQLKTAAQDAYYVLNSYINTGDKTAREQIYSSYKICYDNADLVLETAYEISNNEEKYQFVPEGGYQVEINAASMNEYLATIYGNFEPSERESLYRDHMQRVHDEKAKKRLELIKEEKYY